MRRLWCWLRQCLVLPLRMQDLIAIRAKPLRFSILHHLFRDLWIMASLVPTFITRIAKDYHVSWWAVLSEAVLAEGELFPTAIDLGLDFGVFLD